MSDSDSQQASRRSLRIPYPSRQIAFHQLLVGARKVYLMDALSEALGRIQPSVLKSQIIQFVPEDAQQILAAAGIRDEHVFPLPVVLEDSPRLVGYYRLLLGIPQKTFHRAETGMGIFKSTEQSGKLGAVQQQHLPEFCSVMGAALADLIRQISPTVTHRDIAELPLLTLGSQLQGSNNTIIGKQATEGVFLAVGEIVEAFAIKKSERQIVVRNASGRHVTIRLASDPDVAIEEMVGDSHRRLVAIEIKGGADASNVHNRAGEAEKSHQKARNAGYRDFWTIISKRGIDPMKLQRESPTTTVWLDVSEILARQGSDWDSFRHELSGLIGIPL